MEINNAKKSGPSKITKADITSNFKLDEQEGPNKGKPLNASLVNGILRMTYYESVLQDSIKLILFMVMLVMLLKVSQQ